MDFEIVDSKELIPEPVKVSCFHCCSTEKKNYTHGMLRNVFYCNDCYKDLPFINSAIDLKINKINKELEDCINGLVDKENKIKKLTEQLNDVYGFIEKLLKYSEDIKSKEIEL